MGISLLTVSTVHHVNLLTLNGRIMEYLKHNKMIYSQTCFVQRQKKVLKNIFKTNYRYGFLSMLPRSPIYFNTLFKGTVA